MVVVVLNGPGQLSGLLSLSLLSANTQVDIISFLWVARTKNFLEFLFNLEINQQWEVGGGRPFYGRKKMIKFV